ncbi:MAG TPA: VCBS repeat-containing protein [Chitinophagaceae bacterium]|nr:VCBS repeat-containing protein [Chitinophagaceae bacterium]
MKNLSILLTGVLALCIQDVNSQSLASVRNNPIQLTLQSGLSNFMQGGSVDSNYFLKGGVYSSLEGNYFWKNFGVGARAGFFTNSIDKNALVEFAKSRKAAPGRTDMITDSYKGFYLMSGPAFQSSFEKWKVQSSLLGGLFNRPGGSVGVTEKGAADLVYYKNIYDQASSFAWSAGLSVGYGISRNINVGVHADYLTTKNNLTNYDMLRGGGHEGKSVSEQAGFLNTGVKLTYSFVSKPRDAASGQASGKMNDISQNAGMVQNEQKSSDTCKCENKLMDAEQMVPHVVEIEFNTVDEAQKFLSTYKPLLEARAASSGLASGKRQHSPVVFKSTSVGGGNASPLYDAQGLEKSNPLYQDNGLAGTNPMHKGNDKRSSMAGESLRGMVVKKADGSQVFAFLPFEVDLAEVLSFEDGRVTVTISNKTWDEGASQSEEREVQSGLATGKRQYAAVAIGDLDGDGKADYILRSASFSSGTARDVTNDANLTWGKYVVAGDVNGDGFDDYILQSGGEGKFKYTSGGIMHEDSWDQQKRDAASGLSTGKRQHKPMAIGDLDNDGLTDYVIISLNHEIKSPRDVATGQSSGKRSKIESFTIKQSILLEADLDGDGEMEMVSDVKAPRDVATGQSSGKRMKAKEKVNVWHIKFAKDLDDDGLYEGFLMSKDNDEMTIKSNQTRVALASGDLDGDGVAEFNHEVKSPRDVATGQSSGKRMSTNEGPAKVVEKATSGVKQTMQTQVLVVNDNSNEGTDPTNKTVNTTRANIKRHQAVACSDGSCAFDCVIELDGVSYHARVVSVLKTRHDTVKNSIGNIR